MTLREGQAEHATFTDRRERDPGQPRRPGGTYDRQRNMAPLPWRDPAFRAAVDTIQQMRGRQLSPLGLHELASRRVSRDEIIAREAVREGVGRARLTPQELRAIHERVPITRIIAVSRNMMQQTQIIPHLSDQTARIPRPDWSHDITREFFFPRPEDFTREPQRSNVPPPGELMEAGLTGAQEAGTAKASLTLTEYLIDHQPRDVKDASLTTLISLLGAHFVRFGVGEQERMELFDGLAQNPQHIYGFYRAFSGAQSLEDAVEHLPWHQVSQQRQG